MFNLSPQSAAAYAAEVRIAQARAKSSSTAIAIGWAILPFAIQTVLHPADELLAEYKLSGTALPNVFTAAQLGHGRLIAIAACVVIIVVQYLAMKSYYRIVRQHSGVPPLWPMSILITGLVGNGLWWFFFPLDPQGIVVGLAPTMLAFACETLCEKMATETVEEETKNGFLT